MIEVAAMSRRSARSILGFLMLVCSACQTRPLTTTPDATTPDTNAPSCATAGCGVAPLCGTACQSPCGCCGCTPGERSGDLVCTGLCYAPAPAADGGSDGDGGDVCQLPFEAGSCDALFTVYAFVNGACVQRTYGGCDGNGNRFSTLEECLATCAGQPQPGGCPPNRIAKSICLACGLAGGCARTATVCALVCDADAGVTPCEPGLPFCYQGVCQNAFCI